MNDDSSPAVGLGLKLRYLQMYEMWQLSHQYFTHLYLLKQRNYEFIIGILREVLLGR
jgi:hypothetical protein